ncbi:GIY-YIG nuclease family protein [Cronobacter dublinensis]|uniref:GIY-YIG nuclease family protein n=1 Tax=Cronobacter dublinensis TaxID=413497 RepID=A0A9Q4T6U6_9ENTR|nr:MULTISPECIES: GIY-YIG nuclease family protein [Cronobacter]NCH73589.1 GIY-YIG nuclease family protein [Cronobacter dublinensis]NCH89987.1 GIY-YIG nuclease family protein [Cronobacter dublinensis]
MKLFEYLKMVFPKLTPENTKVHLAQRNDYKEEPLAKFREETFDDWQCWQKRLEFGRNYVVSLIRVPGTDTWLFAGAFQQTGNAEKKAYPGRKELYYQYYLQKIPETEEYAGRMYVSFKNTGRNFIRLGESIQNELVISAISPVRLSFGEFPGYRNIVLDRSSIGAIVRLNLESWRTALSVVKGIYVLTDRDEGKLYVGKADGVEGIWGRWKYYFGSGHGGNIGLKEAFGTGNENRLQNITFAILEVMDPNAENSEISRRESHWKQILLSREFGHNRN